MKLDFEMFLVWIARHHVVLIAGFSSTVVLLVILLSILFMNNRESRKHQELAQSIYSVFNPEPIERNEIFMEDEPDFVPKFLYYREPQTRWTPEFVSRFWQTLDDKTLQDLQQAADNTMNRLLEAIP